MDKGKAVHIRCLCELGKGTSVVVSDQGQGFDPDAVSDPSTIEGVKGEHGRGIHWMKLAMDEVSFDREVQKFACGRAPQRNGTAWSHYKFQGPPEVQNLAFLRRLWGRIGTRATESIDLECDRRAHNPKVVSSNLPPQPFS